MNRDLLATALLRVRAARHRKTPNFQAEVERALEEAISQPFGAPLDVARIHSRHPNPARAAVWGAVVERLEADAELAIHRPRRIAAEPVNDEASPTCLQYRVTIATDVGPETPGGRLAALAEAGEAIVRLRRDADGTPWLLYLVERERAGRELEVLLWAPELMHAAE